MKFLSLLFISEALAGGLVAPRCITDNCLRAVTGTGSNDKATRIVKAASDCSTFQAAVIDTVVGPGSTYWSTLTCGQTLPAHHKRGVVVMPTAPAVPTYVSACSGAMRFSSACSCGYGLTAAATTTVPAWVTTSFTSPLCTVTV